MWFVYASVDKAVFGSDNALSMPLSEITLAHCQLNREEQTPIKFETQHNFHFRENEFENVVCKMADISSRLQCVSSCFVVCRIRAMTRTRLTHWGRDKMAAILLLWLMHCFHTSRFLSCVNVFIYILYIPVSRTHVFCYLFYSLSVVLHHWLQ